MNSVFVVFLFVFFVCNVNYLKAGDPYDGYLISTIKDINTNLSGSSLERLSYIRYAIGEFVVKNKPNVDLKKVGPYIHGISEAIDFRKELSVCINSVDDKSDDGANVYENMIAHPLAAKFIGADLFPPEKSKIKGGFVRYNEYLAPIIKESKKECAMDNLLAQQTLVKMLNIQNDLNCNFVALKKKLNENDSIENLDAEFNIIYSYLRKCPAVDRKVVIKNFCHHLKPHLKNPNFFWGEGNDEFNKNNNSVIHSLNFASYLNYLFKNNKLNKENYESLLSSLNLINKELSSVNKSVLLENMDKKLKELVPGLLTNSNSEPAFVKSAILDDIISSFSRPRSGVPSMFERYISRLPETYEEPEKIAIGNLIGMMNEKDKKKLFELLSEKEDHWNDIGFDEIDCDQFSEHKINKPN